MLISFLITNSSSVVTFTCVNEITLSGLSFLFVICTQSNHIIIFSIDGKLIITQSISAETIFINVQIFRRANFIGIAASISDHLVVHVRLEGGEINIAIIHRRKIILNELRLILFNLRSSSKHGAVNQLHIGPNFHVGVIGFDFFFLSITNTDYFTIGQNILNFVVDLFGLGMIRNIGIYCKCQNESNQSGSYSILNLANGLTTFLFTDHGAILGTGHGDFIGGIKLSGIHFSDILSFIIDSIR